MYLSNTEASSPQQAAGCDKQLRVYKVIQRNHWVILTQHKARMETALTADSASAQQQNTRVLILFPKNPSITLLFNTCQLLDQKTKKTKIEKIRVKSQKTSTV